MTCTLSAWRRARRGLALLALSGAAGCASASTAPGTLLAEVWSRVEFDTSGQAARVEVVGEADYPPRFVQEVRTRLARARIQPPVVDGVAAVLSTGVKLEFEITPGTPQATVRIANLSIGPLPIRRPYAPFPDDIARAADWQGSVTASCTVGEAGVCQAITVRASAGVAESARRFARESLERWAFEPQRVNGRPVDAVHTERFDLRARRLEPEDFRQDKFQRILQNR
ncbi:MAG: energy transducer TonB [Rubrivivax sp.]